MSPPREHLVGDRFAYDGVVGNALLVPTALLVGSGLQASWLGMSALWLLRAWYHECGHAVVAWLSGRVALPTPFGFTSVGRDRVLGAALTLSAALVALAVFSARGRRWARLAVAVVLLAAQVWLTWVATLEETGIAISFAGCAGELLLGAAGAAAFHLRLPDRLRWDFWRYPAALASGAVFGGAWLSWRLLALEPERLPVGSALFGRDGHGDLDGLLRAGWTAEGIIGAYLVIGGGAAAILAVQWAVFVARAVMLARR